MNTEPASRRSTANTRDGALRTWADAFRVSCRRLVGHELSRMASVPVRVRLWDGSVVENGDREPVATVHIRRPQALARLLIDGEFQFAELYAKGDIEIEGDLVALLEHSNRSAVHSVSATTTIAERLRGHHRLLAGFHARRNARFHYDVGNDFYRLWLDSTMTYSCAHFAQADMTLAEAQIAKLDLICRKLDLQPGEHVIEAGSGWGSLALHMAERYGVSVRAYNVSEAQTSHARDEAARRGLTKNVEFVMDDFRAITGHCDAFVSVGMLEHVGRRHYAELGSVVSRVLSPSGRGLIHSIGRRKAAPTNRWIDRRIFPGGYAPTLREMLDVFEPNDLAVWDVENLRPHYVETLACWLAEFEKSAETIADRYGDPFLRRWRLYLASSEASFRAGWHELFQVVFTRPAYSGFSRTRAIAR